MFFKRFKTLTAAMTLACFFVGPGGILPELQAAEVLWGPREAGAAVFDSIVIPAELGTVQAFTGGSGPLLVHISEVHGHYETQKNIEKILRYLKDQYGIEQVLVEGSAFPLHSDRLQFSGDAFTNRSILDELARKSIASAPELFLADSGGEVRGIENPGSYVRNGRVFQDVLSEQKKTEDFVNNLHLQIERLTSPYLHRELREFLKQLQNFDQGLMGFPEWIEILRSLAFEFLETDLQNPFYQAEWPMLLRVFMLTRLEEKFDPAAFEPEKKAFLDAVRRFTQPEALVEEYLNPDYFNHQLPAPAASRLFEELVRRLPADFDYTRYPQVNLLIGHLILHSELEFDHLTVEMESLVDRIAQAMSLDEREREIIRLLRDYRLLSHLLALKLTPQEYDQALSRRENLHPQALMERFLAVNSEKRVQDLEFGNTHEIDPLFRKAFEFYAGAKERDQDMIENVEKILAGSPQAKAALITGGFHTGPFYRHFSTRGYRYVSVQPAVRDFSENTQYERLILDYYLTAGENRRSTYRNIPYLATTSAEAGALGVRGFDKLWRSEIQPVIDAYLRSEHRASEPFEISAEKAASRIRELALAQNREQAAVTRQFRDDQLLAKAYEEAEKELKRLQAERQIFTAGALDAFERILHPQSPKNRNGREGLTRLLFYLAADFQVYITPLQRQTAAAAKSAGEKASLPAAGNQIQILEEEGANLPPLILAAEKVVDQYYANGRSVRSDLIAFMDLWFKQKQWHRFSQPTNRTIKSFNAYRARYLAGDRSESATVVENALRNVALTILNGFVFSELETQKNVIEGDEDLFTLSAAAEILEDSDFTAVEKQLFLIGYAYRTASTLRIVKGEQADVGRMIDKFKYLTTYLAKQGLVEERLMEPLFEESDNTKPGTYQHVTTDIGVFADALQTTAELTGADADLEKLISRFLPVQWEIKRRMILRDQMLSRLAELMDSTRGAFKTSGWKSGAADAPVRNKLLPAETVKHYADIRRILTEDFGFQDGEVVYPLGGPDISTALLLTNARTVKIIDRLDFKGIYPSVEVNRFRKRFLREKNHSGYHSNFFLSFIGSASQMLLWELHAMGASNISVSDEPASDGAYTISFKWSYDGKSEPVERRILYYQKEIDLNDQAAGLNPELQGGLYLSKANFDRGLPQGIELPPLILSFQTVEREGYRTLRLNEMLKLEEGRTDGYASLGRAVLLVKEDFAAQKPVSRHELRSDPPSESPLSKEEELAYHRVRTQVEWTWLGIFAGYGILLGAVLEFAYARSALAGTLPAGTPFLAGFAAPLAFVARTVYRLRAHYREIKKLQTPDSSEQNRSEQRTLHTPGFEKYEQLETFWQTLDHSPRRSADGSSFVSTPFHVLSYILKLIGTEAGPLQGRNYLSLGAGSLSDSLAAASLFGMNVTAVELDARLSAQAQASLARAVSEGIPGAESITLRGETDAFDLDWSAQDVVYFFYTQSNRNADDEEPVRQAMGRRFAEKMRELKPGAVLALLFTGAQILGGQAAFEALEDMPYESYQVSEGMTGLYLHLYRVPQRSEQRNTEDAEAQAVQLFVQIQQQLVQLAPKMTEVLRDIPRPESPELETTRRSGSGSDFGLFDDLPWKDADDDETEEKLPQQSPRGFVSFERVEPLRESFDKVEEWFQELRRLLDENDGRLKTLGHMLERTRSQLERLEFYQSGGGPRNELRSLAFTKEEIPELLHDIRNSLGALTMYMDRLAELLPDDARATDIFRRYSRLSQILFPPVSDSELTVEDMAGIFEQIGELTRADNAALFNTLVQENLGTDPELDDGERNYQINLRQTISDLLREAWFVHALSESSLGRENDASSEVNLHAVLDRFAGMNSRLKEIVIKDYGSGPGLALVNEDGTSAVSEIYLMTHELSLIRILKNLIGNAVYAVKDRGRDARIVLKTRLVQDGGAVEISIEDNGTGIKAEDLSRIWDAYFTTKGSEGTGLGLHIVRETVEETLGGSIHVVSEEGKGTSFTLTLPLEAAEEDSGDVQPLVPEGLVTRGIRFLTPEMYLDIRRSGFLPPAERADDSGGIPSKFPDKVSLSISSDRLFRSSGTHEYGPFARPHQNKTIPFGEHASFVVSPQYIRENSGQFELAGRILDKDNLMRGDYQKGLALTGLDEKQVYIKSETAFPDEIHASFVAPEALDGIIVSEKLAPQIREWDRRYGLEPLPLYLVNDAPFVKQLEVLQETIETDILPERQRAELRTLQAGDARQAAEYFENVDFLTTFNDIFETEQGQRSLRTLLYYPVSRLLHDFLLLDSATREYRLTVTALSLNMNLLALKELRRIYGELDPVVHVSKRSDIIRILRTIQYYAIDVESDAGGRYSVINRRTWDNRSDRTIRIIEDMISESAPGKIRIADMAVSDGTSSYELAKRLDSQGVDFSIEAFDRFTEIHFFRTDQFLIVFDDENRILQMLALDGSLFNADRETAAFQALEQMIRSISAGEKALLRFQGLLETVSLMNPAAADYAAAHPDRLSYGRHNVFEPLAGNFTIVRVLGLLMRGSYAYFSDERIREGLRSLAGGLDIGGFLINGTLWRDGQQLDSYRKTDEELVYRDDLSANAAPGPDWQTISLRSEQRSTDEEPPLLIEDNGPRETLWQRISARFALEKKITGGSTKVYKSGLYPNYFLKKKEVPKTEIFRIEAPWNLDLDYSRMSAELAARGLAIEEKPIAVRISDDPGVEPIVTNLTWQRRVSPVDAVWDNRLHHREALARGVNGFLRKLLLAGYFDADFKMGNLAVYERGSSMAVGLIDFDFVYHLPESSDPEVIYNWLKDRNFKNNGRLHLSPGEHFVTNFAAYEDGDDHESSARRREAARLSFLRKIIFKDMEPELVRMAFVRVYDRARRAYSGLNLNADERKNPPVEKAREVKQALLDGISAEPLIDDAIRRLAVYISEVRSAPRDGSAAPAQLPRSEQRLSETILADAAFVKSAEVYRQLLVPTEIEARYGRDVYQNVVHTLTLHLQPQSAARPLDLNPKIRQLIESDMPVMNALIRKAEADGLNRHIFDDLSTTLSAEPWQSADIHPYLMLLLAAVPQFEYTITVNRGQESALRQALQSFFQENADQLGFKLEDLLGRNLHIEVIDAPRELQQLVDRSASRTEASRAVLAEGGEVLNRLNARPGLARIKISPEKADETYRRHFDSALLAAELIDELTREYLRQHDDSELYELDQSRRLLLEMAVLERYLTSA